MTTARQVFVETLDETFVVIAGVGKKTGRHANIYSAHEALAT